MAEYVPLELLTLKEVAALAKVTTMTVYRWRRSGVLPAPLKVGGRLRWPRQELEQALKSLPREVAPNSPLRLPPPKES